MLKRPTQKTLTAEEMAKVVTASREQSTDNQIVKSYDPNFPAFSIPVNKKILVYVPNFTVTNPDGSQSLRMDRACYHSIRDGRSYGYVRCSRDVVLPSIGLDGSCPFCDAEQEVLELFFKQREDIAKKKGIDVKSSEAKELLKEDTQKLNQQRAVGQKVAKVTFPIVVIDTEDGSTKPKLNAEGKLNGTIYWYTVAEKFFEETWLKALDSLTDAEGNTPSNPAGLWTILNYHYTDKDSEANVRDSARKLSVSYALAMQETYKEWAKYYDAQAEAWTPEKAIETLVDNQLRSMDEMVEACDTVMRSTRDTLALYQQASLSGDTGVNAQIGVNANANAVLESFGATPAGTGALPTAGGQPPVGITTTDANVGVGVPQTPIGG